MIPGAEANVFLYIRKDFLSHFFPATYCTVKSESVARFCINYVIGTRSSHYIFLVDPIRIIP
jgi:hypothetical protein